MIEFDSEMVAEADDDAIFDGDRVPVAEYVLERVRVMEEPCDGVPVALLVRVGVFDDASILDSSISRRESAGSVGEGSGEVGGESRTASEAVASTADPTAAVVSIHNTSICRMVGIVGAARSHTASVAGCVLR